MTSTLRAFALIYRQSPSGRSGAVRDYTLDWEEFLRKAKLHDGDARELAEQELVSAERESGGLLQIDRHNRSRDKEKIRLKHPGGEAWLFAVIGASSPTAERENLAAFFSQAASTGIPSSCAEGWSRWFSSLAARARSGESIAPFKRENGSGNAALLQALTGVLNWREESLIRYASSVIFGDSKILESLRPRVNAALCEITGREDAVLEDFGITDKPRSVWTHGPLVLDLPYGRIDFSALSGPVAISATDLLAARSVESSAPLCLTVENDSVFRELLKSRLGVLLVQTSFPGAATRLLFQRLPSQIPCYHFGDSDPAGFGILRDLREKTGRAFLPLLMDFRASSGAPRLTDGEKKDITRLLASPALTDVRPELEAMLASGTKGSFEQESLSVTLALEAISAITAS